MSSFAIDDAMMANAIQKINQIVTEMSKVHENNELKKPVMKLSRVLQQILEHQILTPEMRAKSNALHVRDNASEESSMSGNDGSDSSEARTGVGSTKTPSSIKTPQEGMNVTPTATPHDEMTAGDPHCRLCGEGIVYYGCDLCTICELAVPRGTYYCGCQDIRLYRAPLPSDLVAYNKSRDLTAKNPEAPYTLEKHVTGGNKIDTQYLSLSSDPLCPL
ncbi:hypothetical protein B484DRAFT_464106 [Ochromonadaceae sp. CCMP2298]|nr:hypothetical protein B484DRAFT_464106 [Ochromonadaceae sp. CCMP2298]